MKHTLALLAGIALMACSPSEPAAPAAPAETPVAPASEPAPAPAPPPADTAGTDTCNMAQYSALVGKPSTDPGVPAASSTVRIIKPGDQVTMDFQATRVNFEVNTAGVITNIKCG